MKDIQNRQDIEQLVNEFYERARAHEELGPIFNDHIGNLWVLHYDTLYRFWETLLLDNRVYHGAPFPKHLDLPIKDHHFDQWIELFTQTVKDLFEGPTADLAIEKAVTIATAFRSKMKSMVLI